MVFHDHRLMPRPRPDREFVKLLPFKKVAADVERLTSSPLNVTDLEFGAAGDGVEDDASAIQAAIDAAEAAGGGVVHLPDGTYAVSGDLTIDSDNVVLQGDGRSTLLEFTDGGIVVDGTATHLTNVGLKSLTVDRSGTAGPAVRLQGGGVGTGVVRWGLTDVHVVGSTGAGLLIDGSYLGTVVNCYWQGCAVGIELRRDDPTDNIGVNAVTFHGGEVQGCTQAALLTETNAVSFFGTTFEGCPSGVEMVESCSGTTFDGCYFEGNSSVDLIAGSTTPIGLGLSVSGCYFADAAGADAYAIELRNSLGSDVRGCAFVGYTTAGVHVSDNNNVVDGFVESCYSGTDVVDLGTNTAVNAPTYTGATIEAPSSGGEAFGVKVAGDSNNRVALVPSAIGGSVRFGSGSGGVDVEFRRDSSSRARLLAALRVDGAGGFNGKLPNTPSLPAAGTVTADDLRQALIDLGLCT